MLGEDLKPWLIEINCSPTMARCTAVTTEMCDNVLEDTCKGRINKSNKSQRFDEFSSSVMIDRKYNRSNDLGRFELIYKGQPVAVPSYVGIDLRIEGKTNEFYLYFTNQMGKSGSIWNLSNVYFTLWISERSAREI